MHGELQNRGLYVGEYCHYEREYCDFRLSLVNEDKFDRGVMFSFSPFSP